jgi:undecaprenyl-diphosphatase
VWSFYFCKEQVVKEIIDAIILGIVQGLTEFLPVSSSGHLELMKFILGDKAIPEESLLMTVVLHFATALATTVVFRKEIMRIIKGVFQKNNTEDRLFAGKIIISMIPAVLVGLMFEKEIETLFSQNILLVCFMLMVTAVLLFYASFQHDKELPVTFKSSFIIGLAQAVAILPGVSRSGATISTALILGVDRKNAASFSFLMVIPLIFGKMAKDILDGTLATASVNVPAMLAGFIMAFLSGYMACKWMIKIVRNSKLQVFAWYCVLVALLGFAYIFL